MKKVLLLAAFCAIAIQLKAQNAVLFKIKVLPEHEYSSTVKMNLNMEMSYEGDSTVMAQIKESGATVPIIMVIENGMHTEMKTGAPNSKNEIPYSLILQSESPKMTTNGLSTPLPTPPSQAVYGKCQPGGMLDVDSIAGQKMNDTLKMALLKMIKNLQANIQFPEKMMKIGDTFTQEKPFDIPVGDLGLKMNVKAIYKLLSVNAGKANFDVSFMMDVNMKLDPNSQESKGNMSGGGTGTVEYDIAANFPTHINQNMDLIYTMPLPGQKLTGKGKMKMVIEQQTTVK